MAVMKLVNQLLFTLIHPTAVTFGGQQEKKAMVAEKSFFVCFLFILFFSESHVAWVITSGASVFF